MAGNKTGITAPLKRLKGLFFFQCSLMRVKEKKFGNFPIWGEYRCLIFVHKRANLRSKQNLKQSRYF